MSTKNSNAELRAYLPQIEELDPHIAQLIGQLTVQFLYPDLIILADDSRVQIDGVTEMLAAKDQHPAVYPLIKDTLDAMKNVPSLPIRVQELVIEAYLYVIKSIAMQAFPQITFFSLYTGRDSEKVKPLLQKYWQGLTGKDFEKQPIDLEKDFFSLTPAQIQKLAEDWWNFFLTPQSNLKGMIDHLVSHLESIS